MNTTGPELKNGVIYTFYSFKGGTGRTMALANVATLMAKWEHKVLVVDWDLEAPGIERFFAQNNPEIASLRASRPGIVDLIQTYSTGRDLDWRDCLIECQPGVSLITAGRDDGDYVSNIQQLDFEKLFKEKKLGTYIELLRKEWSDTFDFVLIDSRTGVTDIGGICTVHLPDILVVFFTATHTSTQGARDIVERARRAQERLPLDRGRLIAVPVPARDESRTEYERAVQWKKIFAERFQQFYLDWLPSSLAPSEAVELMRIPYVPYWSFGEELPVLAEGMHDPGSLGYAYEILARLLTARLDWHRALEGRTLAPPPIQSHHELDRDWLERHRNLAKKGLTESGRKGYMEVIHFCIDAFIKKQHRELLLAAEQAMVHTFGWPIGVVLKNRPEFRPRPNSDGVFAELNTDHDYDYWTLVKNGDFYSLMSLFEESMAENAIFIDTRIMRTTEAILHCINLYKLLGIDPGARVSISIQYGGLQGRNLSSSKGDLLRVFSSRIFEDEVLATATFRLDINEEGIVKLVRELCEPLFILFDFTQIPDSTFDQITKRFMQGTV